MFTKFLIVLIILLTLALSQNCHSSCLTCSTYGINQCLSCPPPLQLTPTKQCIAPSNGTVLEIINSTFSYANSTYISNLSTSAADWVSGFLQVNMDSGHDISLQGLTGILSIKIRISVEQNASLYCDNSQVRISTNNGLNESYLVTIQNYVLNTSLPTQYLLTPNITFSFSAVSPVVGYTCPYISFKDISFIIQLCQPPCSVCSGNASTCSVCGLDSNGNQTYIINSSQCSATCSASYLILGNNYYCDACNTACLFCTGLASSHCTTCNNTGGYYLSNSSNTTCQLCNGYTSGNPLTCHPCDSTCLTCTNSSTTCTSCNGTHLDPNTFTCGSCIGAYFLNPVTNSCVSCHIGCLVCSGALSNQCFLCDGNYTDSLGIVTPYYLPVGQTTCLTSCPSGQFAESPLLNNCSSCSAECITCSGNATYCTGAQCSNNFYFYQNACISSCPNNTYTYSGQCLTQCPSGFQGSIGTTSTCVVCTGNTCTSSFAVQTKIANGGSNFEHKVSLPQGLSSSNSAQAIKNGVTVSITTGSGRLLASTVSLSVSSVTISGSRDFITILTNYQEVNFLSSSIFISFQAGTLLTSSGSAYTQLSATVTLDNPTFLNSYYNILGQNKSLQVQGTLFVLISFILFLSSIPLRNNKFTTECLSFVCMIQLFGLARVQKISYDFSFFDSLKGFSHYELGFIPNRFADPFFNNNYSQVAEDSAIFAFGTQNFIINFGSLFYFLMGFELIMMVYLCYLKYKEAENSLQVFPSNRQQSEQSLRFESNEHYKLFWQLQECIISFWSCILLYGSGLCLLSLKNNTISSNNLQYAFSILLSFLVWLGYGFHYAIRVRRQVQFDFYKINNLAIIIGLLLLAMEYNLGLLLINFSQTVLTFIDYRYYKEHKFNSSLFLTERISFWLIINTALLKFNYIALLVVAGLFFSFIAVVKSFYLGRILWEICEDIETSEAVSENSDFINLGSSKLASQNQSVNEEVVPNRKIPHFKNNNVESNNTLLQPPAAANPQRQMLPPQIQEWNQEQFQPQIKRARKIRNKPLAEPMKMIDVTKGNSEPIEQIKLKEVSEQNSPKPQLPFSKKQPQLYEIQIDNSSQNSQRGNKIEGPQQPQLTWNQKELYD